MPPHNISVYIRRIEAFAEVSILRYTTEILLERSSIHVPVLQSWEMSDSGSPIWALTAGEIGQMDGSELQSDKRQRPLVLWMI